VGGGGRRALWTGRKEYAVEEEAELRMQKKKGEGSKRFIF
jgi:hypothetical protein